MNQLRQENCNVLEPSQPREFENILNQLDSEIEDALISSDELIKQSLTFRDYGNKELSCEKENGNEPKQDDLINQIYERISRLRKVNEGLNKAKVNFRKLI